MRQISLLIFCISFLFFTQISCSSSNFIDTLPSGVPKGYVAFDYLWSEAKGLIDCDISIYILMTNENKETIYSHIANISMANPFNTNPRTIIAKSPGKYAFMIKYKPLFEDGFTLSRDVEIKENMLTLVRIHFNRISTTHNIAMNKTKIVYEANIVVGESVPLTKKE